MANFSFDEALSKDNPTENSICDIILEAVKLRSYKDLSRKDLALKTGVTEKDVSDFESFKFNSISLEVFSKILSALEIKIQIKN